MTKWVEAQAIFKVNETTMNRFVYSHIYYSFGAPQEIISNHGPSFGDGLLTRVCEKLNIKHKHATPYYPKSNGSMEKENGIMTWIIRKMVKNQDNC